MYIMFGGESESKTFQEKQMLTCTLGVGTCNRLK